MLAELVEWALSLDREMAFLFALPFIVALAGLFRYMLDSRHTERPAHGQAHATSAAHNRHVWNP